MGLGDFAGSGLMRATKDKESRFHFPNWQFTRADLEEMSHAYHGKSQNAAKIYEAWKLLEILRHDWRLDDGDVLSNVSKFLSGFGTCLVQ